MFFITQIFAMTKYPQEMKLHYFYKNKKKKITIE